MARAALRDGSKTDRVTLRCGSFGQHQGFRAKASQSGCALAIEVDQPVIADIAPAAVLHVPAPDFGELGGKGGVDQKPRNVVVAATDFELVGKKLTMHGGSPAVLMGAPILCAPIY